MDPAKTIKEPLLSNPKGGFRTIPFILVNEALERVASCGLLPNMILYLTREYGIGTAQAAQIIFFWSSASYFTPIVGAVLADSYLGRYRMIVLGSLTSLLGMFLLWLTAAIPEARPPPCAQPYDMCESATTLQLLLLLTAFSVMSIGAGGIRSSSMAFGVDQLDEKDNLKRAGVLESFFSWYYVTSTLSIFFAMTFIVYFQDTFGWKVGFGIPVVLMLLSTITFVSASPLYAKQSKTNPSLLAEFARVIVASFNNRSIKLPSSYDTRAIYYQEGTAHTSPTEKLRFLNKACIIKNPEEDLTLDGKPSDPWSLCTVDQVEEVKAVIRVLPIWSTGIVMSISVSQTSLLVIQASTMDRHIITNSKFEIPSGSFNSFLILSLTLSVALYDHVIVPLASKINGKPTRLSLKHRMGIGLMFSALSMPAIAIVESFRRELAVKEGSLDDPSDVVTMSAMWLLPYLVLGGLTEAFNAIGQHEFYYRELPKSMSSIATTFVALAFSVGNISASFVMKTVDGLTGSGGDSWVSSNINKGHYDYYYWVLASLTFANLVYYLVCSKAYGACRSSNESGIDAGQQE